ncbi:MAG: isoleucine--tRNA ligase [Myxococcota bacterium]
MAQKRQSRYRDRMPFEKVDQAIPNFPELENRVLELWKARRVFERSLEMTRGKPEFVFYEGPPTANGLPHNGHVLTRVIKDLFPRYKTMRGHHVERRAGWDTHGLPVEVEVEKELRIRGREAILEYGVDRFSRRCMDSVFRYTEEWEHLTKRIGFWVDLDTAYVTYHKSYVESVWWALSQLFERGLLYKGHKSVWWWAQGGTALSAGEVGNAYKTVDDPSVYVKFPLEGEEASLVVWTTTPWTLPSNMFAAVHPDYAYAYARDPETRELLVLAEALVPTLGEKLGRTLEVERRVKGRELIGKRYRPPFDAFSKDVEDDRYWNVVAGDRSTSGVPQYFVTLDSGTGVVHIAPAFGEDDWKLWRAHQSKVGELDMFCAVRPDGALDHRLAGLGLEGTWVKDADKTIIRDLKSRSLLVKQETYRHEYPFCWRSDRDPLIQYVREAWFVRTTEHIDAIIDNNQSVAWMPEHIRDGRMGDFLEGNVDWALSRERFWGTPLNIWVCEECGSMVAPSSCADIESRNPDAFAAFRAAKAEDPSLSEHLIVHKPWIDQVELPCAECGGPMRREPEVIDVWFDSGCMPFAQLGYPHQEGSEAAFERSFPADFISEAVDQTRGWFYSLQAVNNLVFPEATSPKPFKRCIVLGHVLDKAGKKESKSSGNYTPPEIILDAVRMEFGVLGADASEALGVKSKPGTALIALEDFEGMDLRSGASLQAYDGAQPERRESLRIEASKKLPRRVVVLPEDTSQRLERAPCPDDVRVAEVPKLPPGQRVMLELEDVPAPGADAFRWFFFAANPPWNSTRHSLSNVRTLQKELPIKLRNVYAFFVTYANIDGFDPVEDEPQKRSAKERPMLDRWITSELERTKIQVTAHMDAFRSYEATQVLSAFVDGLSNWYVRRSRDRFWAAGRAQDKLDALWTLYECLRDVTVLLAPFLPFSTEDMYQNLVRGPYGDELPDSVHLRLFPAGDPVRVDESLSRDMAEVRALVSLGLQVRASHKLKTRQMLGQAKLVLADPSRRENIAAYSDLIRDELNVRELVFIERADAFVEFKTKPNFRQLGKRLGPKMKQVQKALANMPSSHVVAALESGGVDIELDDGSVRLGPDEVQVAVEAKEGFAAASERVGVVILDTSLDESLIQEGLFREVLAKIQAYRKELQLDFADRIELGLDGDEGLVGLCAERVESLGKEVLATGIQFRADASAVAETSKQVDVDGRSLRLRVRRLGSSRK